ncbi:MAG TPA: ABC transporter permease [Acidimicrobiales bacterium]|jgi:ABC-2 type transport system permease protein|nr:ABC transporter permease [Acidimicrobiales bacterium]
MTALEQPDQSTVEPSRPAAAVELPLRVITGNPPLRQRLTEIWNYRELLGAQTRKELKVRYKGSVLGFFWSMLNPASQILVYYVVFQLVLKNGTPSYAVYLATGLLCWNLLTMSLTVAVNSVVSHASIVKKVAFPREILALAPSGASVVHLGLQSIVMLVFLAAFRHGPAVAYLPILIPAVIALVMFSSALGVLLAAINVRVRDMEHALAIVLQVWFWATPILVTYRQVLKMASEHDTLLSHGLFLLYRLDPMTPIVMSFQRAIYGATSPRGSTGSIVHVLPDHANQWWYTWQLLAVMGFSLVLFVFALKVFGRCEGSFAEEL